MVEVLPKYLEDPERYCSRINSLLNQNSTEWQTVWKAAIPELCNLSSNKLRDINSLLKPIESAFKSKDLKLRVQAFECWAHFLSRCPEISVSKSEKLWNVLAVPLTAQNHSVYIVLSAKLKTWDAFVDAAYQSHPNALKNVIPAILKCLFGPSPQNVEPACKFSALFETCGQLYLKIMKKCVEFPVEISLIFSYLGKAIPPLSNSPNTIKLANSIWSETLGIMSKGGWQTEHFNYLIRTLENLFSDHQNDGFKLLSNFLMIKFSIDASIPPDRLTPHMNLLVRCLFRPPVKKTVVCNIMNSMLKRCADPLFLFYEVDRVLIDKIKDDKSDVDVLWTAVASCYTKWIKNKSNRSNRPNDANEIDTSIKILLFPLKNFCEISNETDRLNEVIKQWKSCYEECVISSGSDNFLPAFFEKIEVSIDATIPRLVVATYMCNAVLSVPKFSEGFIHMKGVLLKIKENMPDIKQLSDSKLKAFAIKYIVNIEAFVQFVKSCQDDFSDVIKTFGFLLPKDANVTTQKESIKSDPDGNSSKPLHERSDNAVMTPTRKQTNFFTRLFSPPVRTYNVQSPISSPSTPKAVKIDDDDVQVIEIKTKPKNSPMTQHQLEKAKSKRHIPALYQDLSQDPSQSYSQSLSQTDSENLFVENKKPNNSINPELCEENANLPAISNTSFTTPIVPRSLSFSTYITSFSEKGGKDLPNASSFSNGDKKGNDSDSSIEEIPKSKTSTNAASNDCELLDKQPTKRKNLKENETPDDIAPVKRSKRLMGRGENGVDDKKGTKTRKFTMSPFSGPKSDTKSCTKNEKSICDKAGAPEIIDLEKESNDVVVANAKDIDNVTASKTVDSLLTPRDENGKSTEKRKWPRKRGNDTPSSVTPRKLRSNPFEDDAKKSTDSDDSVSGQQSTRNGKKTRKKNLLSSSSIYVVVKEAKQPLQVDQISTKLALRIVPPQEMNAEKESSVADKNTFSEPETLSKKSTSSDSVILVEDGATEVISLDDSDSVNATKKPDEGKTELSVTDIPAVPVPNSSDESTFYEGSDLNITNKEQPIRTSSDENIVKETVPSADQNAAVTNAPEVEKLAISPEVTSCTDSNNVENNIDDSTDQRPVETNAVKNSNENAPNVPECNVQSNDEIITNEANLNCDKATTESEPSSLLLNSNSRGFLMRSLAQGPDFSMNTSKSPKTASPKHTHRSKENLLFRSPMSSRASKILFENNKLPSTPTQRATPTPEENAKSPYTPKNYPRRSILKTPDSKKPDANQNTSSPKSAKLRVSFAEKNQVKLFQADDESDSDSSIGTGEIPSNENLMNERLRSQDMLYSPLQNCKDSIEHVLEYIFTSAGIRQASKYFKSMGIDKVGQLASMSTLTANSIPAGDNRVRRLRHALKKYDKQLEKDQRRRPSSRRSEFKNIEISCLIDLPVEAGDNESYSEEEVDPSTDNPELPEEKSKEVPISSSERPILNEEPMDTDIVAAAPNPMENETEMNDISHTKVLKEPVIVLNREFDETNFKSKEPIIALSRELEESNSKPVEPEGPVSEDINNVESSKMAEKEIVEVENKENVDPCSDIVNIDTTSESGSISNTGIEPMEVDEHPRDIPKLTNESINESADYVCTDSNTREEDTNDRRSITMRDIHRYSTVIESNGEGVEKPSETVILSNDATVKESGSLFNENEIISESEKVNESPETISDSQETSISVMDSVIEIPSIDRDLQSTGENEKTSTENENVISESIFSDDQNNDNLAGNTISRDIVNDRDASTVEGLSPENIEQNVANCEEGITDNDMEYLFEHHSDVIIEMWKEVYPYSEPTENSARHFFLKFWKKFISILPKEYELNLRKKK